MPPATHLPWATPPGNDDNAHQCSWCDRAIYMPALPCSIEPVEGLMRMTTSAGQGARCQYELATREPALVREYKQALDDANE